MSQLAAPRTLLGLAAVAVAFAAADTYVVVLSLPDMMASAGLSIDELQRAAPIVSGFLLGYVAMLPLLGRIADLRGRVPVLVASLAIFAFGSLLTAAAYDLDSLVVGRFLQGVGGGGLVPVTLALVADLYPVERRAVPLGVVGAVQELGSVLGPLYGAVVLVFGDWRDIFWINLAVGLVLWAAISRLVRERAEQRRDWIGGVLLVVWLTLLLLTMLRPRDLVTSVAWGGPWVPWVGGSVWLTPIGVATVGCGIALVAWLLFAARRSRPVLVDLPTWWDSVRQADLVGAGLLAAALAGVILAFASADPEVQVFSPVGPWLLLGSAVMSALFWWHSRRSSAPLVPHRSLVRTPAWGSLVVSFFVGAALIAALVDIPIFARVTSYGDSQIKAALVLVEFLIALPVGALLGGALTRRLPSGVVAAVGMASASLGFVLMAGWGLDTLHHLWSSAVLALTGLGFGLALAPVNAALLATTATAVHGVASAMLVVARMVGMLVGISALTTIGLRRYYAVSADIPAPAEVCGNGVTRCEDYTMLLKLAGLEQLHAIFVGAAVAAGIAAVAALVLLRGADTRGIRTGVSTL